MFDEDGFEGGYPLTRALGVEPRNAWWKQKDVTACWEEL